jgi:hypothetical protein
LSVATGGRLTVVDVEVEGAVVSTTVVDVEVEGAVGCTIVVDVEVDGVVGSTIVVDVEVAGVVGSTIVVDVEVEGAVVSTAVVDVDVLELLETAVVVGAGPGVVVDEPPVTGDVDDVGATDVVVDPPPISSSTVAVVRPANAANVCVPAAVFDGMVTVVLNVPSPTDSASPSTTGSLYKTMLTWPPAGNPVPATEIDSPALGEPFDTESDAPGVVSGGLAGGVNPAGADDPGVDGVVDETGVDDDGPPVAGVVVVGVHAAGDAST